MTNVAAAAGSPADADSCPPSPAGTPLSRLPTLQRNALRKLFDRAEFTPEEVARLGYRRLQQAEGIGQKGLTTIQQWLKEYGYEIQPDPQPQRPSGKPSSRNVRRNLEVAMRVLRAHGYVVQRAEDEAVREK